MVPLQDFQTLFVSAVWRKDYFFGGGGFEDMPKGHAQGSWNPLCRFTWTPSSGALRVPIVEGSVTDVMS